MINTLAGMEVNASGDIVTTYLTKMPEAFIVRPFSTLSNAEKTKRDKFYQRLAKLTGQDVVTLWQNKKYALPSVQWVAALMSALQPDIDVYQAGAIANYAGGAVSHQGWTGMSNVEQYDSGDFLDVDNLYSQGTDQVVNLGSALRALKAANPGAHEYAVNTIAAKAARRATQADIVLSKDTQKVIQKELELAKQAITIPANIAKGALDTATTAGKLLTYMPYIIGGTVLLLGYMLYKNRETVGKVAAGVALRRAGL